MAKRRPLLLEPLQDDPGLDASSRHLIRQLQLLYQDGFNFDEVITPVRCHHVMKRLLSSAEDFAQQQHQQKQQLGQGFNAFDESTIVKVRQRVMRAVAIFRTMELFWERVPDVLSSNGNSRNHPNTTNKPRTVLPVPTYEMYGKILRALASLRAPKQYETTQFTDVPWLCQDALLRLHTFHQQKGIVYLKRPSIEEWNQVLLTWANAHGDRDHPDKALHATQFFLDMKLQYKVTPDASSYAHALRACAHHDQNQHAKELGARLAVRLWTGVMKDELRNPKFSSFKPTPHVFVFFMRAVGNLPDSKEAEPYLREAWESACSMGVVNEHILFELQQSCTEVVYKELLKSYLDQLNPDKFWKPRNATDKTYHVALMKLLPHDWTKRITNAAPSIKNANPASRRSSN